LFNEVPHCDKRWISGIIDIQFSRFFIVRVAGYEGEKR